MKRNEIINVVLVIIVEGNYNNNSSIYVVIVVIFFLSFSLSPVLICCMDLLRNFSIYIYLYLTIFSSYTNN